MYYKLPREYLNYVGEETKTEDFDEFWSENVQVVNHFPLQYERIKTDYCYRNKKVEKLIFKGLDNTAVYGWYIYSTNPGNKHCIVTTHGYRSSRKQPFLYLHWLDMGYDVLVFDLRLQGGETGCNTYLSGPMTEVIALNIFERDQSYLYQIYTDMMLAVRLPEMLGYEDYVLEGTSQAGGLAVAIGCLMGSARAVLANVPSNSDIDQRVLQGAGSFNAFQKICRHDAEKFETVIRNLSYFDTKNLANRLTVPLFASVGGKDGVCPAKAFMPTYHRIKSEKQIYYYPFSGHEGGGSLHTEREMSFLQGMAADK